MVSYCSQDPLVLVSLSELNSVIDQMPILRPLITNYGASLDMSYEHISSLNGFI